MEFCALAEPGTGYYFYFFHLKRAQKLTTLNYQRFPLQGGYAHPLSRKWQAKCQLTTSMFMYPIFITDDPNASVEIPTLAGQRSRWGVNKLEEFIGPWVKKGLESVILFGVPFDCVKVCSISLSFPLCVSLNLVISVGWTRNTC